MHQFNGFTRDENDFVTIRCTCGQEFDGFPGEGEAIDELIDHAVVMHVHEQEVLRAATGRRVL